MLKTLSIKVGSLYEGQVIDSLFFVPTNLHNSFCTPKKNAVFCVRWGLSYTNFSCHVYLNSFRARERGRSTS